MTNEIPIGYGQLVVLTHPYVFVSEGLSVKACNLLEDQPLAVMGVADRG